MSLVTMDMPRVMRMRLRRTAPEDGTGEAATCQASPCLGLTIQGHALIWARVHYTWIYTESRG